MTSLVDSFPADGSYGNDDNFVVSFDLDDSDTVVDATLTVLINGFPGIINGVFQTGFTGTITHAALLFTVQFGTMPRFGASHVAVYIDVSDGLGEFQLSFTFGVNVQTITQLSARTWCDGSRIDLAWVNPTGAVAVRIRRSQFSFCKFVTDPGIDIYVGTPITCYVDGPGPVPTTYPIGTPQNTTPLQQNQFYYYTIFFAYNFGVGGAGGGPGGMGSDSFLARGSFAGVSRLSVSRGLGDTGIPGGGGGSGPASTPWFWSPNAMVEGLAIRNFTQIYGNYVYGWLPRNYRQQDGDPGRGTDRYKLRDYCSMIQCGVNLYRGWLEGLALLRDPDTMPAGRMGVASNQTGILEGLSWDLGMPSEKSFDGGVLRRIAMGLIPVYETKGTCPGLVLLTKLFATWNSRCAEAIDPTCGVIDSVLTTWNAVSKLNQVTPSDFTDNPTITVGQIVIKTDSIFTADINNPLADTVPPTSAGIPTVGVIIDAMGTFACVKSVSAASAGSQTFLFTDITAELRSSITGSGTGSAGHFSITSIDHTSYPWQFPFSGGFSAPIFGTNAWEGFVIKDHTGALFPVVSSVATSAGTTVLNVTGTPATGTFTLAQSFGSDNSTPVFHATLYTGEIALIYDPRWDIRLNDETQIGPWSLFTALGALNTIGFAPTLADVTIWAQGVHSLLGKATGVATNSLTDSAQTWTPNQWAGYYLIPNWNSLGSIYKIIGNNATTILVDVSALDFPAGIGGVNDVAIAGSHYVILTEPNAVVYSRLVQLLPSFVPVDTRAFVKFES